MNDKKQSPKSVVVRVRLPIRYVERLHSICDARESNMNKVINGIIENALEAEKERT